ncbi:hypothetical protein ACQEVF_17715 [Nonomuraea polychroma]|uniref:hypothetical protein n=1 Tax=Nonomuraea polychroma TaxID=46176 RepID=UPI003D8E026D
MNASCLFARKWFYLCAAILLTIVAAVTQIPSLLPFPELVTTICAIILAAALYYRSYDYHAELMKLRFGGKSPGPPIPLQIPSSERIKAITKALQTIKRNEYDLAFMADMLMQPQEYIRRVVEDAEIQEQSLRVKVSLTIDCPRTSGDGQATPKALIPILWLEKGVFLDNFDLEDESGKSIPLLNVADSRGFISVIARGIFDASIRPAAGVRRVRSDGMEAEEFSQRAWNDLFQRVWLIGNPDRLIEHADDATLRNEIQQPFLAELVNKLSGSNDEDRTKRAQLLKFYDLLKNNYILIGEIKSASQVVIKYSKTIPLFQQSGGGSKMGGKFVRFCRFIMASRPHRFIVPLYWPFLVSEYHFRMNAPAGQYVQSHYLRKIDTDAQHPTATPLKIVDDFPDEDSRPYVRIRYRSGLPLAHLYIRRLARVTNQPPNIDTVIDLAEVPPGTIGVVTLGSIFTTVWIVLFALGWVGPSNTYIPSFLLAFSALALSWLGFSDRESLLRGPLTARLGIFSTLLFSLLAVVLAVASPGFAQQKSLEISILAVVAPDHSAINIWWLLLVGASLYISLHLAATTVARMRRYSKLVRKWESLAEEPRV